MGKKPRKKGKGSAQSGADGMGAARVLFSKGALSYYDGVYSEAIKFFTMALLQNTQNRKFASNILACRAQSKMRQGDYNGAIQDCTTSLKLNPTNTFATFRRAHAYGAVSNIGSALLDLDACSKMESIQNRHLSHLKRAMSDAFRSSESDYNKDIFDKITCSIGIFVEELAGDPETGVVGLEDIDETEIPSLDYTHYESCDESPDETSPQQKSIVTNQKETGFAYLEDDEYQSAIEEFTNAILMERRDHELFSGRGTANRKLHKFSEAIEDLSKSLARHESPEIYLERANAWFSIGNLEMSREDILKAIALNPKKHEIVEDLQDGLSKIMEGYRTKLLLHPNNPVYPARFIRAVKDAELYSDKLESLVFEEDE